MNIHTHSRVARTSARAVDAKRIAFSIAAVAAAIVVLVACWASIVQPAHAETLSAAASSSPSGDAPDAPVVQTADGPVQGIATPTGVEFRGIPYAAPPTGDLRWTPPQPVASWTDTRDATVFPPVCPQAPPSPWGQSEDCLYLNVTAPARDAAASGELPVIVYIHGGGFSYGEGADYDPTKLAGDGAIVVTFNYRLGLLGFLAHPALADGPGASTGNFGYQDQQAALRWVQQNIDQFGGARDNVTIVGHSAGGLSVLAQLASPGAKGLFHRAVIQAGAFALQQQSLAQAEQAGQASAAAVGCPDQSAECLRAVSVDTLVAHEQASFTPGYVDGTVLRESVGSAIATGRFNRVPIINGTNTQEERIFTTIGRSVTKGATILLPGPIDASNYVSTIATNFGISTTKAKLIAAAYPLSKYATPAHAFSTLNSDANFSCPAYALDIAASRYVPTFAYEFNDALAPQRDVPDGLGAPFAATHQSELQYLFDLPNSQLPGGLSPDQEQLAANMRAAWVQFAAIGSPSTEAVQWPQFKALNPRIVSFETPGSKVERDFALTHKCGVWAAAALLANL
ncbi:carboxylesterase/lipase family protein [Agromyces larvae]|uniref:Carboxylic ester hydrolase n=1 Tax=Agromyces larvae TaxID=2929802 RepID=A0ABY4C1U4_9MICO|nr:carboxylesterase family protein [Agromyces larvae]UOE44984.1 carboxylesterase family protein [Agromyces larvae]